MAPVPAGAVRNLLGVLADLGVGVENLTLGTSKLVGILAKVASEEVPVHTYHKVS